MKTFNLLLVLVLALGAFAFVPQGETLAGGTVECVGDKCNSGYDMGDCSAGPCKLMNGYNFINVPAGPYKVHAQTLTSVPRWPAGLVLFPKPVDVYFNPGETVALVEVCFPQGNKTGQVFKYTNAGWLPLPTTFVGGLACGAAWGGGVYAYFGYK
jgi:hypothetical protein